MMVLAGCAACAGAPKSDALPTAEVELICSAEMSSGAIERFPFADKTETLRAWLDERLRDARARTFYFEELPQTNVDYQDDRLRDTAQQAGVASCPMADYLEFVGQLPREGFTFDDCVSACMARHRGRAKLEAACRRGCGG